MIVVYENVQSDKTYKELKILWTLNSVHGLFFTQDVIFFISVFRPFNLF